ncbi:MAG: tricarballylate/proton symporter TcuC [Anaeromyxobacteraceae bacterium]
MLTPAERSKKIRAVVRVASGNFLEMFDFMVYGYYAAAIARAFFPTGSEFASLMLSLATFGAGFLMRPLGAIVLGAYIDHHGRRKGLMVTLALMSVGTLSIAVVPGYATIGIFAPLLVLLGRLLQGFSAGVELGGVSVYLAEIATPGRKGFYTSWQSGSQQVAVVVAALLGVGLNRVLNPAQMSVWGWRIPLLLGCAIIPFLFVIRRSLQETEEFQARRHHPSPREIFRATMANWRLVLAGVALVTMTTVSFYTITAYTPTFGQTVLKLTAGDSLVVTLCVGLSNLFWLPVMGALSDRIGRRPVIVAGWALYAVTYLAFGWATQAWQVWALLVLYGVYYALAEGPQRAVVADLAPAWARGSAFGWYNAVVGLVALPASLGFGALADRFGARVPFTVSALLAALASLWLALLVQRPRSA